MFVPSSTEGERVPEEIADGPANEVYFRKQRFDVFSNPHVEPAVKHLDPDSIVVFGVTLDVCVKFAVEGFLKRGYNVTVVRDATRALDESRRSELLSDWEQKGATIQKADDVVASMGQSVRQPRTTND